MKYELCFILGIVDIASAHPWAHRSSQELRPLTLGCWNLGFRALTNKKAGENANKAGGTSEIIIMDACVNNYVIINIYIYLYIYMHELPPFVVNLNENMRNWYNMIQLNKRAKQTEQSQSTNLQKSKLQDNNMCLHCICTQSSNDIKFHQRTWEQWPYHQQELLSALPQLGSKEGLDQGNSKWTCQNLTNIIIW